MNRNKIIKILNLFKDSNNCVPYERFEKVADMILSPTYGLPDSVPLDSGLREEKLLFDSLSEFVFKTFPDASSNSHFRHKPYSTIGESMFSDSEFCFHLF